VLCGVVAKLSNIVSNPTSMNWRYPIRVAELERKIDKIPPPNSNINVLKLIWQTLTKFCVTFTFFIWISETFNDDI
jgi:hypothetical protein